MSETWNDDFKWRRVRVSSELLSAFLSGQHAPVSACTAPADLAVVGLVEVSSGPHGHYEFIVWSETFEPIANDGERRLEEIPSVMFEYTR